MAYSQRYHDEIAGLTDWWRNRRRSMELCGLLSYTPEQRAIGVDAMRPEIQKLADRAFNERLENGYELSYSQMCRAFFAAVEEVHPWTP